MKQGTQALFLASPAGGQRFALFHPAAGVASARGAVLYIHPFAEEMNKARRMAALQARALAQAGFDVLQLDLLGCGDSSGDFGDASWTAWVQDILLGVQWLRQQSGASLWLWGLRAGCLLAVDAARQLAEPVHFLFWQPSTSGKLVLQQFLRLKAASELLGGQAKGVVQALRDQLAQGESVEVAGYRLAAGLAHGLEQATLTPIAPAAGAQLVWLEVSTRADVAFSPVSLQSQAAWQQSGYALHSQIVTGPAFWQTTEIEEAPALLEASTVAMTPAFISA